MIFKQTVRQSFGSIEKTGITVNVLWAENEEEAFGLAYDNQTSEGYKDWDLNTKVVIEIPPDMLTPPVE